MKSKRYVVSAAVPRSLTSLTRSPWITTANCTGLVCWRTPPKPRQARPCARFGVHALSFRFKSAASSMTEKDEWAFPRELQPRAGEVDFDLAVTLNAVVALRADVPED